jgi:probable HAF family extracellular repeat protein
MLFGPIRTRAVLWLNALHSATGIAMATTFVAILFSSAFISHAAAEQQYTITDLGTLGGMRSYATAINNSGQVVGYADTSASNNDEARHAFLYSGGTMSDLGALGGIGSRANGINDLGQVVGSSP